MKVAILAGGMGTRLGTLTREVPKPLVEVGGQPILWHVMKTYAHHGFDEFVLALGHQAQAIKRWALELSIQGDLTVYPKANVVERSDEGVPWRIDLVDTGPSTQTGGRLKRLAPYLGNETFMCTWADGVADIDLSRLLAFHRSHGRLATVTAVRPPARFGHLDIASSGQVQRFTEKPPAAEGWINGAYFVLEPEVLERIAGDATVWEREPLEGLAREGQLMAYAHTGFWQCMDTVRDQQRLEALWRSTSPPWRVWTPPKPRELPRQTRREGAA